MIETDDDTPSLNRPILIAAFEGWNDAGDAATAALDHMMTTWEARYLGAMDPEDYYDFQVNRPHVVIDDEDAETPPQSHDGLRVITHREPGEGGAEQAPAPNPAAPRLLVWPTTTFSYARPDGLDQDVIFVRGVEPNMRWRTYCEEIIDLAQTYDVSLVITLGALLTDIPHTRPVPVTSTTNDPDLVQTYSVELSTYEGPTGIVGVLQALCQRAEIDGISLWSAVPHYVAQPPSPKATLALIRRLEDLLDVTIPHRELDDDARAWQRGVDELAEEDEEIAEYIQTLEEASDAADLPEASGEAIAREFEKYLRRRGPKTQGG